jgi:hypothetical protein
MTDFWRQFGFVRCCRILEFNPLEILADGPRRVTAHSRIGLGQEYILLTSPD